MHGVVPAAGRGTRLRPLTDDRPKPLVEVADRPLVEYAFETLLAAGVDDLVVVVGYRGDQLREHCGDCFDGVPVRYAEQDSPGGMADAVLAAREHVDGPFAVADGDGVVRAPSAIRRCVERQRDPDVDATTLLERVPPAAAREKALCRVDDRGDLTAVENKPPDPPDPSRVASAFHTFSPAVFRACELLRRSPRGEYELADAMGVLVRARRRVVGVDVGEGEWVGNVNTSEERDAVERRLREEPGAGRREGDV